MRQWRTLLFLLVLTGAVQANPPLNVVGPPDTFYGPLSADPAFKTAIRYREDGDDMRAYQEYLNAAEAQPGTLIEATGRLLAAGRVRSQLSFRNTPEGLSAFQTQCDRVIASFPGTRYWFVARLFRIFSEEAWVSNSATAQVKIDQLIAEVGGPPVTQIVKDNNRRPFSESQVLQAYRSDLAAVYAGQAQQRGGKDGERIFLFLRESFPSYERRHGATEYFRSKFEQPAASWDSETMPGVPSQPDKTPPKLLDLTPHPSASLSTRPNFKITLTDGPWYNFQIDQLATRVLMDGQDVTDQLTRTSQFNTNPEHPQADLETLTLRYRPATPLTAGTHRLTLIAVDNGKNQAKTIADYTVKGGGDNDNVDEDDGQGDQDQQGHQGGDQGMGPASTWLAWALQGWQRCVSWLQTLPVG